MTQILHIRPNDLYITTGNKYKIIKDSFHYDIWEFCFTSRNIVEIDGGYM